MILGRTVMMGRQRFCFCFFPFTPLTDGSESAQRGQRGDSTLRGVLSLQPLQTSSVTLPGSFNRHVLPPGGLVFPGVETSAPDACSSSGSY